MILSVYSSLLIFLFLILTVFTTLGNLMSEKIKTHSIETVSEASNVKVVTHVKGET